MNNGKLPRLQSLSPVGRFIVVHGCENCPALQNKAGQFSQQAAQAATGPAGPQKHSREAGQTKFA